jgi:ribosomal protein S20
MVDEKGIMGTAGATVNASDMVSHANEAIKNAQEVADRSGTNTFVPHNGSMARAGDVVKEAQTSLKGANDAIDKAEAGATVLHNGSSRKVENLTNDAQASLKGANDAIDKRMAEAPVADTENTMGRGAGQMVKAGELMEAAAEKFWEGKDKGDVSKMNMSAVFSG